MKNDNRNKPLIYTFVTILILILFFTISPHIKFNNHEYECDTGIIVDKYKVLTEKSMLNIEHYDYYTVVKCNGINRTQHYYYTQLIDWKSDIIGYEKIVCWEV